MSSTETVQQGQRSPKMRAGSQSLQNGVVATSVAVNSIPAPWNCPAGEEELGWREPRPRLRPAPEQSPHSTTSWCAKSNTISPRTLDEQATLQGVAMADCVVLWEGVSSQGGEEGSLRRGMPRAFYKAAGIWAKLQGSASAEVETRSNEVICGVWTQFGRRSWTAFCLQSAAASVHTV